MLKEFKNDPSFKYRLISPHYWRWHWKWNALMAILLGAPTVGMIIGNKLDLSATFLIIMGFLCIFAIMAKMTYDTDRWDRCTKCGCQYTSGEKYCSCCGIAREGNTIDGITWRLQKENKTPMKGD